MCSCREVDALKTQLQRAHREKELASKPQSNPAHEQELQAAKAHAQQAAAASAHHVKELNALKGWDRLLLDRPFIHNPTLDPGDTTFLQCHVRACTCLMVEGSVIAGLLIMHVCSKCHGGC